MKPEALDREVGERASTAATPVPHSECECDSHLRGPRFPQSSNHIVNAVDIGSFIEREPKGAGQHPRGDSIGRPLRVTASSAGMDPVGGNGPGRREGQKCWLGSTVDAK